MTASYIFAMGLAIPVLAFGFIKTSQAIAIAGLMMTLKIRIHQEEKPTQMIMTCRSIHCQSNHRGGVLNYNSMIIHIILIFVSQTDLPSEGPALAQLSASARNLSFNFSCFLPHEIWATAWVPSTTNFPTFTIDNLATTIYDAVHASTDLSVNGPSMTDLVRTFEGLIDQCLSAGDCTKLLASNRHFEV